MRIDLAARLVTVALAVWLMAAPAVLGYSGAAETSDRVVGPIAGAFAFVACWQILAAMRWVTVPLGLWLIAAPVVLGYDHTSAWISSMASGAVIVAAAFVGGDDGEFDGGWRSVRPSAWRTPPAS